MKQKNLFLMASLMTMLMIIAGCGKENSSGPFESVKIGNQYWMKKNLDVDTFRNGDPVPYAAADVQWDKAGTDGEPAWCYYNNDPANGAKYGKLYNWYAVNDPRGLAPKGWHIAAEYEFDSLISYLGGDSIAGKKMKSTSGWADDLGGLPGNGTDESGFSGLPGGYRSINNDFRAIGYEGGWWSSTPNILFYLNNGDTKIEKDDLSPKRGYYVRCVKD